MVWVVSRKNKKIIDTPLPFPDGKGPVRITAGGASFLTFNLI